jgi:hypothetical protein
VYRSRFSAGVRLFEFANRLVTHVQVVPLRCELPKRNGDLP